MIIGLTGGIASGKSLVAECFRAAAVPVIDTDEIARQVVAPGQPAWLRLCTQFGAQYVLPDGQLDRGALAALVFADPTARRLLESITHPAIFTAVDQHIAALRQSPTPPPLIVVVVPLLFEVHAETRFDLIVVVYARETQMRDRLMRRGGYSKAEAEARLAAQLPIEEKVRRADYLLDNTGTPEQTCTQVQAFLQQLRRNARA